MNTISFTNTDLAKKCLRLIRNTAPAAELNERVCYGLELDPKYVDVIVQRWQG
jgi:hypothetical protein